MLEGAACPGAQGSWLHCIQRQETEMNADALFSQKPQRILTSINLI